MTRVIIENGWDTRKDDERETAPFEPVVKYQCICPNRGMADEQGFIVYSPSCLFPGHGLKVRYIPKALIQLDEIGGPISRRNRGNS